MDFSHRKNSAVVRIINKDGKPASNVSVDYRLTNHEFLFGCGAFENNPVVVSKAYKVAIDMFPKVFKHIEELLNIKGIGEKKFEKASSANFSEIGKPSQLKLIAFFCFLVKLLRCFFL